MPEIEFHERKDLSVIVGVHIGGQVICMSPEDWLETVRDIAVQIEARIKKTKIYIPCTCGQDDGLHEWDCAITRNKRA